MNFSVKHQEKYSRLELLARTFFGLFYIGIPHLTLISILAIGVYFCQIALFFIILFTGKYPKGIWDFLVNFYKYSIRIYSSLMNLCDGYPEFGLRGNHPNIEFSVPYKEEVSRLRMLVRWLLGWILLIPHIIILYLRIFVVFFIFIIAWFSVLFIGKYPKGMFSFVEGTWRWYMRIYSWIIFFTDEYPTFTGDILETESNN